MTRRCTRLPPGKSRCKWKGPEKSFHIVDLGDGRERWYCPACFDGFMEFLGHPVPDMVENLITGEVRHVHTSPASLN